jgi:hypothetical protein
VLRDGGARQGGTQDVREAVKKRGAKGPKAAKKAKKAKYAF